MSVLVPILLSTILSRAIRWAFLALSASDMDELFCVAEFMASILGEILNSPRKQAVSGSRELHREQIARAMLTATVRQFAPPPAAEVFTLLGDVELH